MKKLLAVLAFGFCSLTVRAQIVQGSNWAMPQGINEGITVPPVVGGGSCIGQDGYGHPCPVKAELKCGKYQHLYHADAHKEQIPCNTGVYLSYCVGPTFDVPEVDECIDDTRQVTERDWQALMQRIDKLESQAKK